MFGLGATRTDKRVKVRCYARPCDHREKILNKAIMVSIQRVFCFLLHRTEQRKVFNGATRNERKCAGIREKKKKSSNYDGRRTGWCCFVIVTTITRSMASLHLFPSVGRTLLLPRCPDHTHNLLGGQNPHPIRVGSPSFLCSPSEIDNL